VGWGVARNSFCCNADFNRQACGKGAAPATLDALAESILRYGRLKPALRTISALVMRLEPAPTPP
jgi:hypothetical protein